MIPLIPRPAAAQTFPTAPADWVPFHCGGANMADGTNDTPNATGALDLVGTTTAPAGYHAVDDDFLYLRLRLGADPRQGQRLQANAWGFELDRNNSRTTYEVLFSVSGTGASDQVAIYQHPTTVTANSPADPANVPAAFTYPFATNAQVTAAGSTLGGANDAFLDLALPWDDLAQVGIEPDTRVFVWAGSSTIPNALDLDLACYGGAGWSLSGIGGDADFTFPDPTVTAGGDGDGDGDGGGGGGGGTGPRTLEGGLGCAMAGHSTGTPLASLLGLFGLALLLLRSRRRA